MLLLWLRLDSSALTRLLWAKEVSKASMSAYLVAGEATRSM